MEEIDRSKNCPFLLRIFVSFSKHNPISDYDHGNFPRQDAYGKELRVYTWNDCTLNELTETISRTYKEAYVPGTEFDFAIVKPHSELEKCTMEELGVTFNDMSSDVGRKTLRQCKFKVGYYLDVAVRNPPKRPFPREDYNYGNSGGRGGYGGGRERDFGRDRNDNYHIREERNGYGAGRDRDRDRNTDFVQNFDRDYGRGYKRGYGRDQNYGRSRRGDQGNYRGVFKWGRGGHYGNRY